MVCASTFILELNELAQKSPPEARIMATVGRLEVFPNSPNTIPSLVKFTVDMRCEDPGAMDIVEEQCTEMTEDIASALRCTRDITIINKRMPEDFGKNVVDSVRDAVKELQLSSRDIRSGAGHDACWMNRLMESGMIFIPCEKGISHNPKENVSPTDIKNGVDVLMQATLTLAGADAPGQVCKAGTDA